MDFTEISEWLDNCESYYKRLVEDEHESEQPIRRNVAVAPRLYKTVRSAGDRRFRKILRGFSICEVERSPFQLQFHNAAVLACSKFIFGHDFEFRRPYIMEYFRVCEIHQLIVLVAPRRGGKTLGTAMFIACMLVYVTDIPMVIFSTGQRASTLMLKTTKGYVHKLGASRRIIVNNEKALQLSEVELGAGRGIKSAEAKELQTTHKTSTLIALPANEYGNTYTYTHVDRIFFCSE